MNDKTKTHGKHTADESAHDLARTLVGVAMLTRAEIRKLLDLLAQRVVVEPTDSFPYTVTAPGFGYSDDAAICALQGKLSIMMEAARD